MIHIWNTLSLRIAAFPELLRTQQTQAVLEALTLLNIHITILYTIYIYIYILHKNYKTKLCQSSKFPVDVGSQNLLISPETNVAPSTQTYYQYIYIYMHIYIYIYIYNTQKTSSHYDGLQNFQLASGVRVCS